MSRTAGRRGYGVGPAAGGDEETYEIARLCARIADRHKAREIVILDVERLLVITGCFVIATGDSRKQLQAIADAVHEALRARGLRRYGLEGYEEGRWILADYGDVILQLLDAEARQRYNLELIWGDAPRVGWEPEQDSPPAPGAARPPAQS
ncbi:MAG: hypothetical protein KatS3mg102_1174 [Planctomycetota bacterium]|nr:MAG: hypothetical protein KatS3mg102_1174 [Planctomycetota bacterium]